MGNIKFFLITGATFIIVTAMLNDQKKRESQKQEVVALATLPEAIIPSAHYVEPKMILEDFFYFLPNDEQLVSQKNRSTEYGTARILNPEAFVL